MNNFNFKTYSRISGPLILLLIIGGIYFSTISSRRAENEKFVFDVIKVLNEISATRETNIISTDNYYEGAYSMKEHIDNASRIIGSWGGNTRDYIKESVEEFNIGLSDLKAANESLFSIIEHPTDQGVGRFIVKLKEGREKILGAAVSSVWQSGNGAVSLSGSQKERIIEYIDRVFKEEIQNYYKNKDNEGFEQSEEVWAVLIVRNVLSTDSPESMFPEAQ